MLCCKFKEKEISFAWQPIFCAVHAMWVASDKNNLLHIRNKLEIHTLISCLLLKCPACIQTEPPLLFFLDE